MYRKHRFQNVESLTNRKGHRACSTYYFSRSGSLLVYRELVPDLMRVMDSIRRLLAALLQHAPKREGVLYIFSIKVVCIRNI